MFSCASAQTPAPKNPEPVPQETCADKCQQELFFDAANDLFPHESVPLYSVPKYKADALMQDSLGREIRAYCAYMTREENPYLSSDSISAARKEYELSELNRRILAYGPPIEGKALFCHGIPEFKSVEEFFAVVRFRIGMEDKSGKKPVLIRKVLLQFQYIPTEMDSATGATTIHLTPMWGVPENSKFGIISEEWEIPGSKKREKRDPYGKGRDSPKLAPGRGKDFPPLPIPLKDGLQKPPKKLLMNPPVHNRYNRHRLARLGK